MIDINENNMKEKIPLRRMISNVFFVLGYAFREDKKMVLLYIGNFCLFSIVNALFDSYLIKLIIDLLSDATASVNGLLIWICVGLVSVSGAAALNAFTENWLQIRLVRVTGNLQRQFIRKSADIDLICYDKPEYFEDFVIAASQCDEMLLKGLQSITYILGNVLAMMTAGSLLLTINPIVALFPIAGFIVNIVTRFAITKEEYNYNIAKKKINRKSDYSKRVFYQPEYAKELKLTDIAVPLRAQFNAALDEEKEMARGYGIRIAILSLINWIVVFTVLSYTCIPAYLGYLALVKLSISMGDVVSMENAANTIKNRLDATNYALVYFQDVGQFAERFRRFIDYEENLETCKGDRAVPQNDSTIEIRGMSYRYDGAEKDTLTDINMTIKPGEKIAIVGENGAGKTTFIKLLMRLYDCTGGEIRYGGSDIKHYPTKDYRRCFGAVFQDYQIYASTLAENVIMDKVSESDSANIVDSLKLADFSHKLDKLPLGIDTEMTREFSDGGTMLSGGEAQKVAIARMFARHDKIPVAILDEPSSALDPVAEYTLNTNMLESAEHSTVIFISHRLSTTRMADRIYLFEQGRIVEQGTHDELMAQGGEYAAMFEKQAHNYLYSN